MMSKGGVGVHAGKTALVTASTDGIGFAIVKRLVQEQARVVVSSRRQANVDEAVRKLKAIAGDNAANVTGCVCHVGKAEDRARAVAMAVKHSLTGSIDMFVSNAAVNPTITKISEMQETVVDKLVDINFKSHILLYIEVAKHLSQGASLVFVSSVTAFHPSLPLSLYAACKSGLLGLIKALAQELAETGGRVNGVAPGYVPTNFSSSLMADEQASDVLKGFTMLKRFGTPDEIANVVSFLLGPESSYVTGETIVVAGGMQSRL